MLGGCGYHLGSGMVPLPYRTVTVPIVGEDEDGRFTDSLIRHLSSSGRFEYRYNEADLILFVCLQNLRHEHIGYRYDRNKEGKLVKSVIPTETRLKLAAKVTLVESCTGCVIRGPVFIEASVDYDHDWYTSRDQINQFSLGQVTDYDLASETALTPLSDRLSEKIVDYLMYAW